MEPGMGKTIAQRRAAKALRRKAVVRAKRMAELAVRRKSGDEDDWAPAILPRPFKVSEALIAVAEPVTAEADDLDTLRRGLIVAMFAWNVSLLPETERNDEIRRVHGEWFGSGDKTGESDEESLGSFEEVITTLIARKQALYPVDYLRLVDLKLSETAGTYHVTVASEFDISALEAQEKTEAGRSFAKRLRSAAHLSPMTG